MVQKSGPARVGRAAWGAPLLPLLLVPLTGCPPTPPKPTATLTVSVQAEADPACLAVTIASDTTERRKVDMARGQKEVVLAGLPTGEVVLSFYGHLVECSKVDKTAVPRTTGGPVTGELVEGTNGPLTIELTEAGAETIAFDPDAPPICKAGGSECRSHGECCARHCEGFDPGQPGPGVCRPDQPPAPTGGRLQYKAEQLNEIRGRASFPAFDGDSFFVAVPRLPDPSGMDTTAGRVRGRYVDPVLRAVGFTRLNKVFTPAAEAAVALPSANFRLLAETACSGEDRTEIGKRLCDQLRAEQMGPPSDLGVADFIADAVGEPLAVLRQDIERERNYWLFSQRERQTPLEHKGVVVLRQGKGEAVTSVYGSVIDQYVIVNEVALNFAAALARAVPILQKVERTDFMVTPRGRQRAQLVLLPYGSPGETRRLTALRFAYRVSVNTTSRVPGRGAYVLWIDATNGDLLKYVAQSGDAQHGVRPWCRDPGSGQDDECTVMLQLPDPMVMGGQYALITPEFEMVNSDAAMALPTDSDVELLIPSVGASCSPGGLDLQFRAASVLAQLDEARRLVGYGGSFTPLEQVRVVIDGMGLENVADFGAPSLYFSRGQVMTTGCIPGSGPTDPLKPHLNGAEDSTVVAHEIAHLFTMQLQTANPPTNCGQPSCPISDPYNRGFFHDYSDGLAAMISDSPCIGGWAAKNRTDGGILGNGHAEVAMACSLASEGSALPRLLFADDDPANAFTDPFDDPPPTSPPRLPDRFPYHRNATGGSKGPYGDGQIVGAALWHTWQGTRSQTLQVGTLGVWGRLNNAIWSSGFAPTICPTNQPQCDINIYRAGREFLIQYATAWLNGGSSAQQSANKLFAAFARAGLFVAPPTCIDGDATTGADPHLCPLGDTGADAIVDIEDQEVDGKVKTGIRLEDDDYVRADLANPPVFRVWTGPPFVFSPAAAAGAPAITPDGAPPLCNEHFEIQIKLPGGVFHPLVSGSATNCVATVAMPSSGDWPAIVALTARTPRVRVEYKVRTWSGVADNERLSTRPGAGLFPAPGAALEFKPSVFWVTNSGAAELLPAVAPPP